MREMQFEWNAHIKNGQYTQHIYLMLIPEISYRSVDKNGWFLALLSIHNQSIALWATEEIKKMYFKTISIKEIEQTIISSGLDYIQYTTVKRSNAGYNKHTFKQVYPIGSLFTLSVIESANEECMLDDFLLS